MKYRLAKMYARTDHSSDTTIPIDIDYLDPISEFVIQLEVTNSTSVSTAHPVGAITKIEIVDGSDVLFSLNGREADALDWYTRGGKFRANWNYAMSGGNSQRLIGLRFGRWLWDEVLALDPKQFSNLQMRITLDIDAGGNTGSHNFITVWANLFDEKAISPSGFLMSKEIKSYSMGSASHEYTDMPTDYPYRSMLIKSLTAGTEPGQQLNSLKLSEDGDKRVVLDDGLNNILRTLGAIYPLVEEDWYYGMAHGSSDLYVAPTQQVTATGNQWRETCIDALLAFYDGDGGQLDCDCYGASANAQIHVKGNLPHGVWSIPFGQPDVIEDWYDVRRVGQLRADLLSTTGGDTDPCKIFLQQYRNY